QQLFNKARLINSAVMAKIHTVDWTPAILNSPTLKVVMNLDWELVAGGKKNLRGAPYSLTEEFVAVYRMHPLIRDSVTMRDYQSGSVIDEVSTEDPAFRHAPAVMTGFGDANVMYSSGMPHPGRLTLNRLPTSLESLHMPAGRATDAPTAA